MFLNELKTENKKTFLKLCVLAALANDVFEDEEKEMIYSYCREMNIPENIPQCNETLEDIVRDLSEKADSREKNIILLETLGIMKSDGVYDEMEKSFMKTLVNGMKINEIILSKMESLLEIYTVVCKELYSTILS